MKVALLADIHANFAALRGFPEAYDELWVIGDLVNFGPKPGEGIDWVRTHAHCVVRGNHDHAVGYDAARCRIPAYQEMAAEIGEYNSFVLTAKESVLDAFQDGLRSAVETFFLKSVLQFTDLAVATGMGQIKTGAVNRGERVANYNRLVGY